MAPFSGARDLKVSLKTQVRLCQDKVTSRVQSHGEPKKPQGGRSQRHWAVVAQPNQNRNAMHTRFRHLEANAERKNLIGKVCVAMRLYLIGQVCYALAKFS